MEVYDLICNYTIINSKIFHIGNDIDLTGINFVPIGTTVKPFTGSLDGGGYTVKT